MKQNVRPAYDTVFFLFLFGMRIVQEGLMHEVVHLPTSHSFHIWRHKDLSGLGCLQAGAALQIHPEPGVLVDEAA